MKIESGTAWLVVALALSIGFLAGCTVNIYVDDADRITTVLNHSCVEVQPDIQLPGLPDGR